MRWTGDVEKCSYVSKSDRLGSSDVWLKSPGTWKKMNERKNAKEQGTNKRTFNSNTGQTPAQIFYQIHTKRH